MPYDRFLIAPINTGYETDLKPWLIPDDAFAQLTNAYVFRGRVRKRFGTVLSGTAGSTADTRYLSSRLAVNIGTTSGAGGLTATVPGVIATSSIGNQFSVGATIFTVVSQGTPSNMIRNTGVGVSTYNTTSGQVVIVGAPANTDVYWYPGNPVMGVTQYLIGEVNNDPTYAFDTQFAYTYDGSRWVRSVLGTPPIWHGDDTQFFWCENYSDFANGNPYIFTTNFNASVPTPSGTDDPIWYFNETSGWAAFSPVVRTSGQFVASCRIIAFYKERLLLINTIENNGDMMTPVNTAYKNRVRWSHWGSAFDANAFLEPFNTTSGLEGDGGWYLDLTTDEEIISAEFIKDRLILFCENSSWEIVFTNNPSAPFLSQKINTELGSEASFSSVPFDKFILTMGNIGVHSCTGANVQRIDEKIPDQVFDIADKEEGVKRVYGIRDYFTELVYWTFPTDNQKDFNKFPNRILVFNYKNQSWALFEDTFTAFGYFGQQLGLTLANADYSWAQDNSTWRSGIINAQFRQIVAGNQQGFMLIVNPDLSFNAQSLVITNIMAAGPVVNLTIINHNLVPGDFIKLFGFSNPDLNVIYKVYDAIDANTISIKDFDLSFVYAGGCTASRVSNINITSKQWNPYVGQSRNVYLAKIDFGVFKTSDGEVTVDYFPSSSNFSMLENTAPGTAVGTGTLETSPYREFYPLELQQELLWHPVYFQTDGEFIQIKIYMSDDQMLDPLIAESKFEFQGLVLYTQPTTSRLQ